ncbi:pseudouridine synthase, partial [Saccharata proteae CBS 121410]
RAAPKPFDPNKYSTRFIALKFAYFGAEYNGLEHHVGNITPLPTIEEELWKALKKTRLISPTPKEGLGENDVNWEGCEYSKCGRTDRGVSAFGQVVGIRVRSNRPLGKRKGGVVAAGETKGEAESVPVVEGENADGLLGMGAEDASVSEDEPVPFDNVKDELQYVRILNNNLPEDIRVLAWCPNPPPDFNARFSCRERRYKYFFTNPAFAPMPGSDGLIMGSPAVNGGIMREGRLDIKAMREAASYLVGLHDFRNLCKVDPSKQITSFMRRITHASIDEVNAGSGFAKYTSDRGFHLPGVGSGTEVARQESDDTALKGPALYTFTLHGTAFLWHQVRHIVAILFLVGQGLEHPTIVKDLLDMEKNPTKPKYEMASDTPLVLWDCIFPEPGTDETDGPMQDSLDWVYVGDERAAVKDSGLEEKFGNKGVVTDLWNVWHERKIDEVLAGSLLDLVAAQGPKYEAQLHDEMPVQGFSRSARVFDGGNTPKLQGHYVPVLKKERMDPVEVLNERYAVKKGLAPKEVAPQGDGGDE